MFQRYPKGRHKDSGQKSRECLELGDGLGESPRQMWRVMGSEG